MSHNTLERESARGYPRANSWAVRDETRALVARVVSH